MPTGVRLSVSGMSFTHKVKVIKLFFAVLTLFTTLELFALERVVLNSALNSYSLGKQFVFLEDKTGMLARQDVLSTANTHRWQPVAQDIPNFGFTESAYWLTVQLDNPSPNNTNWLLEVSYPLLDEISLFLISGESVVAKYSAGDRQPYSSRPIENRHFIFPIHLGAEQHITVLLRVKTLGAMQIPVALWNASAFKIKEQHSLLSQGVFYGVMLAMIVYNFFLFLFIREKIYLIYVFWVISYSAFQATLDGFGFQYLWPGSIWLQEKSLALFIALVILCAIVFGINFLNIKKNYPVVYQWLCMVSAAIIFYLVLFPFIPYSTAIQIMVAMVPPMAVLFLVMGYRCWAMGDTAARYYCLAWSFLLVTGFYSALDKIGLFPRLFTMELTQLGGIIEVFLFSLALADKINTEKRIRLQAQGDMAYQAIHDTLTGLLNRAEFERRLEQVLGGERGPSEQALCYLDLDQFKVINDTCGHVAGDELLRQVSSLLSERVRHRDTLARLGGDEFGLLMENCSLVEGKRVANELRQIIDEFNFVWKDKTFRISVSIGVVPINMGSDSVISILSAVDSACYAAKDQGRNRIHVYHESDMELAKRFGEMQWVSRINTALDDNRFHLFFQSITSIKHGASSRMHYELLLRMKDESGEYILPGDFMSSAERYNLSTKIDHWVVDTAFAWLNKHVNHLNQLDLCTINLSGRSLGDEVFLEYLLGKLHKNQSFTSKICFEITETAAITNLASTIRFINTSKKKGCKFALDDFGSGLSSFAYLKNLPVDFIKIDGEFIKDIVENPINFSMVRSINEIGHVMGKQTIAEFVENSAILRKLQGIGVDYAQGYYIGRPQPIEAMFT